MDETRHQPQDFGIGRLFSDIRDALIVGNARTERIVLWNPCAENIFGYTEQEALQLYLHELVPPNLQPMHRAGLARYQETGTGNLIDNAPVVEVPGVHKDGHEFPVELTLTAIPEAGPNGDRFAMAIVRDVTDRKAAEEARFSLEKMRTSKRQAVAVNDAIVQALAVAKMSMETGDTERGLKAITSALEGAKRIVGDLLTDIGDDEALGPGDLIRDPATRKPPPERDQT